MGLHVLGCRVDVLRTKEEVVPKVGLLPYVPEWKLGMSDVFPLSGISGLPFHSIFLSPLLFFCLVLLLFLSCRFSVKGPFP